MSSIITIIPARGGSKGIPRKNLAPLCGKPLIAWSIEAALGASSVGRVVVSTDDDEIASVSRRFGAEVVMRPAEISGDAASSESALLHTLDSLRAPEGCDPDTVVFLQATSPCRTPTDIEEALQHFREKQADSLFSACVEHFVGRWRRQQEGIKPLNYDPCSRPRRQEFAPEYVENGNIYIFRSSILRETGSRLGGKVSVYEMPRWKSFQIDEPEDLIAAEGFMSRLIREDDRPLGAIKLLVLDFDGVMTDNRVLVDENGVEAVWCSRADGLGVAALLAAGVRVVVLSTEENPVVAARCRKLKIPCIHGQPDKKQALMDLAVKENLAPHDIGFVGNDVNDLGCLHWVGVPIAVADAVQEVRSVAAVVLARRGGRDAVREIADRIRASRTG